MKRYLMWVLGTVLATGFASCTQQSTLEADSSDAGNGADSGMSMPMAPDGQLALRIEQARQAIEATESTRKKGPVQIAVTLMNGRGGKAVPLSQYLFELRTADGINHKVNTIPTTWLIEGNDPDSSTSLEGGYSRRLRIMFDISDEKPVTLTFSVPGEKGIGDGRSASAPVTLEPCTPCGASCTYLDSDPYHCGACDISAYSGAGQYCKDGKVLCSDPKKTACDRQCLDLKANGLTLCDNHCVNLNSDSNNCGACGNKVTIKNAYCGDGLARCITPSDVICGNACTNTKTDDVNCGKCGNACDTALGLHCGIFGDSWGTTRPGHCAGMIRGDKSSAGSTCDAICAAHGYVCGVGHNQAIYDAGTSCGSSSDYSCSTVIPATVTSSACGFKSVPLSYVLCACSL